MRISAARWDVDRWLAAGQRGLPSNAPARAIRRTTRGPPTLPANLSAAIRRKWGASPKGEVPRQFFGLAAALVWLHFSAFNVAGGLMQRQTVASGVVLENVGVAAPVQGGIDLPLRFVAREMFVQNVAEKLQRHGVIGLAVQGNGDWV